MSDREVLERVMEAMQGRYYGKTTGLLIKTALYIK